MATLHRVQAKIDEGRLRQLSYFLDDSGWEAASNGPERAGREFRHMQAPRFCLRAAAAIDDAIKAGAW